MPETKHYKISKSRFNTSPKAEEILNLIQKEEDRLSNKELYEKIKVIDPDVPGYPIFLKFIRELKVQRENRVGYLMSDLKNKILKGESEETVNMKDFLNLIYKNIFSLGSVAIKSEIEDAKAILEKGEDLPVATRKRLMNYFFRGTDAYNKGRSVDIKVRADDREATVVENLIAASQYGHLNDVDIIDVKPTEDESEGEDEGK